MRTLIWHRNDLRIQDNEPIHKAVQDGDEILPVYIIPTKRNERLPFEYGELSVFRQAFLRDSIRSLQENWATFGAELLVLKGNPPEIIASLCEKYSIDNVYTSKEYAAYEILEDVGVASALVNLNCSLTCFHTSTLIHPNQLPFPIQSLPDIFTLFRKEVETHCTFTKPFPTIKHVSPLQHDESSCSIEHHTGSEKGNTLLIGGEKEANTRLNHYVWETDLIATYKDTRNGLLGMDYSSKFSPWLALGCISPRAIASEILKYEQEVVANESTYWLIFELLWRDYFRFVMMKYGNRLFQKGGIRGKKAELRGTLNDYTNWCKGETGNRFIDANMRELNSTGFMSNRGRQNVASYLVHDLHVDWRLGAAYFEKMLIDYDVCSNWGNWAYVAGVGNDPRENRKFNIERQASMYDPDGAYVRTWLD
jgi:deoxyribodipyrimidine photo-lyase